eukprot:2023263-Karenia_brevis.AAC.1
MRGVRRGAIACEKAYRVWATQIHVAKRRLACLEPKSVHVIHDGDGGDDDYYYYYDNDHSGGGGN